MVAQMMSSSLGAMGPLLSNLQTLMVSPEHQLPNPLMEEIELLKQDLETINTCLINLSRSESPNRMAMHWMNEVRDLSYDMQDYIDSMMHPNKMSDYQMNQNILSVVKKFRSLVKQASERHESYELWRWSSNPSYSMVSNGQDPVLTLNGKAKQLVGIGESTDKLIKLLNTDSNDAGAQGHLKVVSILGPAGVGKSTLAKEVYREIGARFECLAFVRVSRMPDTRRLLRSIISQVQCHQRPLYGRSVQDLIDNLREHLQQKRYFIVIDDLWERTSWNIVKSAFPEDTNCSRILITTGIEKVALECCKSIRVLSSQATESEIYSNNHVRAQVGIYKVEPLSTEDSTELFFNEVFGSNHEHSNSSKEYSDEIIKMCGGLPLSIIMVANIFASQPDNAELWHHVKKYLKTSLENNFSTENMMREIVILSYNNLSHHLKTCLLHLNMYPEGCTFMKADLVKQWWAEGFVSAIAGKDINEVAECYFDELVGRGLIQPNHVSFSDEVIFYTVHSTVFEIIRNKSIEENFTTVVDYSETITKLSAKVRRLYLSFSNAKYATKPKNITLSTVRSLTFYGPVQCLPSIREFKLLRVLILEFLVDRKDIDLSGIYRLFQLRYVRITTDDDNIVYLPPSMKGLKYLETLEVYARVKSIPSDIVHLPKLLHLRLQGEIKPPASVVHMKSVRTLQSFDLSSNSEDNIRQLGEMMDLQDLHLTCSTETSDLLEKNLIALASSLGKHGQLKSLVLEPGALRTSICLDCSSRVSSPPVSLQRLELLPPLCIFSRLPEWIGQLRKLYILRIVVMELARDDVNRISGLQELTVLSLYVIQPIAESIIFSRAEFPVLKHFKLRCGILRLEFQAETMPKLRSLNLAFNAHSGEQYRDMIAGIENLLDLQGIIVQIGTAPGAEESDRMAAESVFKDAISRHSKPPSFSIRRADPVEEEIPQFSSPPVCFSCPEILNRLTTANVISEVNEIHVAHDNELRATSDQVSLTDQAVAAARMKGEYPQRIGQPECQYYLKTGTCKFGATCKFHHPREKAAMATRVQFNELGYPLRPNEKECAYYLRRGQCKFGSTCKFHHPQPSTMMVAVRGSVYSPGQSATSPGQHAYQGAVTSWPLSRSASFIASPRWPGHSSYAQVIVPPGLVQVPGWSPYTAQIGSSSSDDQQRTPGAAQYYTGSRQSGTAGIGDQGMFSSYQAGSVPVGLYAVQRENVFPERPDQPECQFYMKTGDCKFGAVCKFHHPRERIIPTPNCALSPLGLPLRPGEPICSFYNRYGMCKFGPNCKFDHPIGSAMYGHASSPTNEAPTSRRMLAHVPSHPEVSPDSGSGRSRRIAHSDSQQIPSVDRSTEREAS